MITGEPSTWRRLSSAIVCVRWLGRERQGVARLFVPREVSVPVTWLVADPSPRRGRYLRGMGRELKASRRSSVPKGSVRARLIGGRDTVCRCDRYPRVTQEREAYSQLPSGTPEGAGRGRFRPHRRLR